MKLYRTYLLLLNTVLLTTPSLAARAGQFVEKDIELSESCSVEVETFLNHPFSSGAMTLTAVGRNGAAIQPAQNKIWREHGTLFIGGLWLDSGGSIPRTAGPRYQFTTGMVTDRGAFKADWPILLRALEKTAILPDPGTRPFHTIHEVELCRSSKFSLRFSLQKVRAFSNQYGNEPERYYLSIQAGERLPELRMNPNEE